MALAAWPPFFEGKAQETPEGCLEKDGSPDAPQGAAAGPGSPGSGGNRFKGAYVNLPPFERSQCVGQGTLPGQAVKVGVNEPPGVRPSVPGKQLKGRGAGLGHPVQVGPQRVSGIDQASEENSRAFSLLSRDRENRPLSGGPNNPPLNRRCSGPAFFRRSSSGNPRKEPHFRAMAAPAANTSGCRAGRRPLRKLRRNMRGRGCP